MRPFTPLLIALFTAGCVRAPARPMAPSSPTAAASGIPSLAGSSYPLGGKASLQASGLADYEVGSVLGQGVFLAMASNQPFFPRGANYVRLVNLTLPWAPGQQTAMHATLDPNFYDHARLDLALSQMQASGYNIVRINLACPFFWVTAQTMPSPPLSLLNMTTPGISPLYLANLEDALSLAEAHGMHMILTGQPSVNYWPGEVAPNRNSQFLDPANVAIIARFWTDLLSSLPRSYWHDIFSIDFYGEASFDLGASPFNQTTGTYTYQGIPYDLSDFNVGDAQGRQALADLAAAGFANAVAQAIKQVDPAMLVSSSEYSPLAAYHPAYDGLNPANVRYGDNSYPFRISALEGTAVDFIDFHQYPLGPSWSMSADLQSAGILTTTVWPKPLLMSEYGMVTSGYGSTATPSVAQDVATQMTRSCAYGFSGWAFYTWDTTEEAGLLTATQDGGAINQAISPDTAPSICSPIPTGVFVASIAGSEGIFYSNGESVCSFDSWAGFLALSGMSAAAAGTALAPLIRDPYQRIPPTMPYTGACDSSTTLPSPPFTPSLIPAGDFIATVGGTTGIYHSNSSRYCWYDTWANFLSITGLSGTALDSAVASMQAGAYSGIPPSMIFTGTCQPPIPAGVFVATEYGNPGIFYSNGSHYCWFSSWASLLQLTGMTSAQAAALVGPMLAGPVSGIPTSMTFDGTCGG